MNPSEWQQAKEVFHAAAEASPAERDSLIARLCENAPGVAAEVRRMLASADTPGILDEPWSDWMKDEGLLPRQLAPDIRLLDRFRVVRLLGRGGMGEVWEAFDEQLGEAVAIKTLHADGVLDPAAVARFKLEAQSSRRVMHPNVCRVHDLFLDGGLPFLTMELLDGETLAEALTRSPNGLPAPQARRVLAESAAALTAAHQIGLVHRDFKPGNIMLTREGRTVVTDFGLARPERPVGSSSVSMIGGTPAYMAPEQAAGGAASKAADIYSFAIVACETLTGRRPAAGGLEALDRRWRAAIRAGLDPEPAARPVSAEMILHNATGLLNRREALAAAILGPAALGAGWVAWNRFGRSGGGASPIALAVLPFESTGIAAQGQEAIGEALSEELATNFTRRRGLRVVAASAARRFRDSKLDLPEIANRLGARYLLAGSVHRQGERVRVFVQLIEGRTNTQVWAERYERPATEILWIEGELIRSVAAHLGVPESGSTAAANYAAQGGEDYLFGRFLLSRRVGESVKRAAEHFERSIAVSPNFANAHAALAEALIVLAETGYAPTGTSVTRARASALRALEIDPRLAEAHACLGFLKAASDLDFPAAERAFRQAIDLNPELVLARQWYSYSLIRLARFEAAKQQAEAAIARDPLAMPAQQNLAAVFFYSRDWPALDRQCAKLLELDPNHFFAHLMLALAAALRGDRITVDRELSQAARNAADLAIYRRMAAESYGITGQKARAASFLNDLLNPMAGVPNSYAASALAAVGRLDEAFVYLERARRDRELFLPMLRVYPGFDPLRGDPRYAALVAQLGLNGG